MATLRQVSAGLLRQTVRFDSRLPGKDGAGNYEGDFAPGFRRRARITPLAGGEEITAARLQGTSPVLIRVRSDSATRKVTPAWRIVDVTTVDGTPRNIAYEITDISNPDEKNIWLEFMAVSGKSG